MNACMLLGSVFYPGKESSWKEPSRSSPHCYKQTNKQNWCPYHADEDNCW